MTQGEVIALIKAFGGSGGGGGGVAPLVCTSHAGEGSTEILDHTFQQIYDAFTSGAQVVFSSDTYNPGDCFILTGASMSDLALWFTDIAFYCDEVDEYPVFTYS